MTTFAELTKTLGPKAKAYLTRVIEDSGSLVLDDNVERWSEVYNDARFGFQNDVLGLEDQIAILQQLPKDMPVYRARKRAMIEEMKYRKVDADTLEHVAWNAIMTTDSEVGTRLIFGLKNKGCSYWRADEDGVGCTMCGYFAGTPFGQEFTADQLIAQVRNILNDSRDIRFDVVDFASDGSFLANNEVSPEARAGIFELIAQEEKVKRVLIETKPGFFSEDKIEDLLGYLRPDQRLEVGFGLETTSPFISNFSINKGYGTEEFERAVESIQRINERNRVNDRPEVSVIVYSMIKPPYLTDKQAIEDTVKTGKYVSELRKRTGVDMSMKIEPGVVPKGTLLETLYEDKVNGERRYNPPSYWSVVEILARLEDAGAADGVRIGSREDMDAFKAFPATYHKIGMLAQHDFIIYDAVQKYNTHRSISRLLAEIEPALESKSLDDWMEREDIDDPVFLRMYGGHRAEIDAYQATAAYEERQQFIDVLFQSLDEIEYGIDTQTKAKTWCQDIEGHKQEMETELSGICSKYFGDTDVELNCIDLIDDDLGLLRMQMKVNYKGKNYDAWLGIPTKKRVELKEVM